jgi:hypothetical protein
MAKSVSSTVISVALLSLLLPLSGCSGAPRTLYGKSIDGQVIDAQTSQPIAGAHVVYLWESASLTGTPFGNAPSAVCYHAAATVTDTQGRFHIAAWEKPQPYALPNREPTGWAYAPGYVPNYLSPPDGPVREPTVHPNDVFKLTPSRAEGDKRLEELSMISRRSCFYGAQSQKDLYPLKKAVYEEAKTYAMTPEQLKRLDRFRDHAAWDWVAPSPTSDIKQLEKEMAEFKRKNLQ